MNLIKKLRPFDYLIIAVVLFGLTAGILTYTGKRATSSNQIETTTKIEMEIYLKGVTSTSEDELFKEGDETFITIRNVPYTKLKIKQVKSNRRKAIMPTFNPKKPYILVNDETAPYLYDYLITVVDDTKITKDGDAVVGGNKIKIGLPVTLEGTKYKLNGIISNFIASPEPINNSKSSLDLDKHTKINQDVQ